MRPDTGEELALSLWDPEAFERLLDLVRDVIPGLLLALGRFAVVDDLVEVDLQQITAPHRHRSGQKVFVGA